MMSLISSKMIKIGNNLSEKKIEKQVAMQESIDCMSNNKVMIPVSMTMCKRRIPSCPGRWSGHSVH